MSKVIYRGPRDWIIEDADPPSPRPETPGSPTYVRRLRDQTAVDLFAKAVADERPYRKVSRFCRDAANALITALGYPVPGEEGGHE